jgi:hypothetical protein
LRKPVGAISRFKGSKTGMGLGMVDRMRMDKKEKRASEIDTEKTSEYQI